MITNDFIKRRNYAECLGTAFNVLCTNFATIFKRTWLFCTIQSLFLGLTVFCLSLWAHGTMSSLPTVVCSCAVALLSVFTFFTNSRTCAGFLHLINGERTKRLTLKHLKVAILFLALLAIVFLAISTINVFVVVSFIERHVSEGNIFIPLFASTALISLIAIFFMLPLVYSATKYLITTDMKFVQIFKRDYRNGLRHVGYIFIVTLLSLLSISVGLVFMISPTLIVVYANQIDCIGIANGDPTGLPGYFKYLIFVTCTLGSFIIRYFGFWTGLVACYAYGHIEAVENERQGACNKTEKALSSQHYTIGNE